MPASIPQILHEWDMWSRYFGLQENHVKMKVACRTKEQQDSLFSRGIPLQAFADQARVLGVTSAAMLPRPTERQLSRRFSRRIDCPITDRYALSTMQMTDCASGTRPTKI